MNSQMKFPPAETENVMVRGQEANFRMPRSLSALNSLQKRRLDDRKRRNEAENHVRPTDMRLKQPNSRTSCEC